MELRLPAGCGFVEVIAEVVFFLFKVGDSMLEPTVRLFIYDSVCRVEFPNDTTCHHLPSHPHREDYVQGLSASYLMYYKVLVNLPAILLGLFCGAWSDRVGRKLPVMLSCLGTILAVIVYMLSMVVNGNIPSLACVLVGAAVRGAFGKSAVITMALHSYISDISSKEARTRKLGKLLSMNYFGYFAGSLMAGALLEVSSFDVIFCIVVFVNSVCILLTLVFMKESVPEAENIDAGLADPVDAQPHKNGSRKRGPFHPVHVRESLEVLLRPRHDRVRCHLLVLFFVIMVHQMCKAGEVDVTLLFVERSPLSWQRQMYGFLLATDYACLGLAVFLLMPAIIWCAKPHDIQIVLIGVTFKVLRLLLLAFSSNTLMVYLAMVFGAPSAMTISGAKSLISKSVKEDEIGKTFSLLSCGEAVSSLLGSVIFTNLYSALLHLFPGFVFLLDAILYVCLFVLLVLLLLDMRTTSQYHLLQSFARKPTALYGAVETPTAGHPSNVAQSFTTAGTSDQTQAKTRDFSRNNAAFEADSTGPELAELDECPDQPPSKQKPLPVVEVHAQDADNTGHIEEGTETEPEKQQQEGTPAGSTEVPDVKERALDITEPTGTADVTSGEEKHTGAGHLNETAAVSPTEAQMTETGQ